MSADLSCLPFQAAYLGSFKAALTLSVLVVFLPAVNYAFTTMTSLSPKRRDLALTRLNCALLLLGYLIIGLAPTVPWMLSGKEGRVPRRCPGRLQTSFR